MFLQQIFRLRLRLLWRCLQILFPYCSSCSIFLWWFILQGLHLFLLSLFFLLLDFFPLILVQQSFLTFPVYHSNEILVCSHLIYARSIFVCACISRKSCRYPFIVILRKGPFHLLLKFLVLIFVHLVKFHQNLAMDTLNSSRFVFII